MEILYVSGKSNSGKTTSLLQALKCFVQANKQQIGRVSIFDVNKPYSQLQGNNVNDVLVRIHSCLQNASSHGTPSDIGCILQLPKHKVGILTEGDSRKTIRKFVELFKKGSHCDIAIIAITQKINGMIEELRRQFTCCCQIAETRKIHGNKSDYNTLWPKEVQKTKNQLLSIMNQKCL